MLVDLKLLIEGQGLDRMLGQKFLERVDVDRET